MYYIETKSDHRQKIAKILLEEEWKGKILDFSKNQIDLDNIDDMYDLSSYLVDLLFEHDCFEICDNCDGEGNTESLSYCGKPVSDCCGGCFDTYKCEDCNGDGFKEHFF